MHTKCGVFEKPFFWKPTEVGLFFVAKLILAEIMYWRLGHCRFWMGHNSTKKPICFIMTMLVSNFQWKKKLKHWFRKFCSWMIFVTLQSKDASMDIYALCCQSDNRPFSEIIGSGSSNENMWACALLSTKGARSCWLQWAALIDWDPPWSLWGLISLPPNFVL